MKNDCIDILLATYNGERYLKGQIFSILSQNHTNWRLLVHDDGSMDDTVNILSEFAKQDSRIILIKDNINLRSPGANFMHLLSFVRSEFICFCDQDDIWFEDRLEVLLKNIIDKPRDKPLVIYSNSLIYRGGHTIGPIVNRVKISTLKQLLFFNGGYQGATAIFNKEMAKFINRDYSFIAMHDQILNLAGIITGGIEFLDHSLLLYRQHSSNVTTHIISNFWIRIAVALQKRNLFVLDINYYNGIEAFYNQHKSHINSKDDRIFKLFLSYPKSHPTKRFISILFENFTIENSKIYLLLKIIFRKFIQNKDNKK